MPGRARSISSILLAAAVLVAVPVMIGAQAPRSMPPEKVRAGLVESRQLWDGKVQGRQVVTPLVLSFEDGEAYADFAAGRIPFTLTLRNVTSGQTVRIAPELLRDGFGRAPDNRVTLLVAIDDLLTPVWDERGCIDTRTEAEATGDGSSAAITLTYAPCGGGPAAAPGRSLTGEAFTPGSRAGARRRAPTPRTPTLSDLYTNPSQNMTAGAANSGIGVVVKKNPGGGAARVTVSTGGSEVAEGDQAARLLRTGPGAVLVRASRGVPSPNPRGF